MHSKKHKSTTELLVHLLPIAWRWHQMFQDMTQQFLSSDLGQHLLANLAHVWHQVDLAQMAALIMQ